MATDPHIRPDGIWDDNWYQQQQQSSGVGGSSGGGGTPWQMPDYAAIAREQLKLRQEANAPIIQSLQSSIPEVQQKFATLGKQIEAKVQPLQQRYDALLKSVTGRGQETLKQVDINTAREFGRRGISTQSGIYEDTQAERARPIREQISSQEMQLGSEREQGLQNLTSLLQQTGSQGIEAVRAIQNGIAQLQAGGSSDALTAAMQMYNSALQNAQAAWQASQPKETSVSDKDRYVIIGDGAMLYDTATGGIIENTKNFAGKTGGGGSGDDGW